MTKIMKCTDPDIMKRTPIQNFDKDAWSKEKEKIMEDGLTLKFMQNEDLKLYLLSTHL